MRTTKPPEVFGRVVRPALWAGLVLLALLAGCGPGTGGTGTGPGGSFTVGPSGGGTIVAGSPSLVLGPRSVCVRDCGGIALQMDPGGVTFASGCLRFDHAGTWTLDEQRVTRIPGVIGRSADGQPSEAAATLQVAFGPETEEPATVVVTLLDAAGRVLLGPQPMVRAQDALDLSGGCAK